jgi:hypothetical protein
MLGPNAELAPAGLGWADVRQLIEYKHEVTAGALLLVRTMLTRLGTKSVEYRHEIRNAETDRLHSSSEQVTVLFDLKRRQAAPLDEAIRRGDNESAITLIESSPVGAPSIRNSPLGFVSVAGVERLTSVTMAPATGVPFELRTRPRIVVNPDPGMTSIPTVLVAPWLEAVTKARPCLRAVTFPRASTATTAGLLTRNVVPTSGELSSSVEPSG